MDNDFAQFTDNRTTSIITSDKTVVDLIDDTIREKTRIRENHDTKKPKTHPEVINDRYKVKRVLGEGSFGIVYLAEDLTLGRLVAIKQLFGSSVDEETHQRFFQEARIAGKLAHPNVINIYNIEQHDSGTSIIMEYVGGGNVSDLIIKHGRLDALQASRIMIGIMTGLDAAHHMEVTHRDIKGSNILVGIGNTPKIADFGVAHLPADAGGIVETDENDEGFVIGTPHYIAPELITGEKTMPRCDIYSAGCVFYEMLTGHHVHGFDNDSDWREIWDQVQNAEITSPLAYYDDIPQSIVYVVGKMLQKNPDSRYQSAIEVLRDLTYACSKIEPSDTGVMPEMLLTNSPQALLYDIIYLLLLDDIITVEERCELNKRAERLGLSESQVHDIEERVRKDCGIVTLQSLDEMSKQISSYIETNNELKLTDQQKSAIRERQVELGISDDELQVIKTELFF